MGATDGFHDTRERDQRRRTLCHRSLPAELPAVKEARDEIARALALEGWPAHGIDKARVVVSELATNAITHARTPFEIALVDDGGLWLEVRDGAPHGTPALSAGGTDWDDHRPGGMGLYLVEAMAGPWQVQRDADGKTVRVRLDEGD